MRRSLVLTTLVWMGTTAALLLVPGAAVANSFKNLVSPGGIYSYDDGRDQFCLKARATSPGSFIRATLTPVDGVGPRRTMENRHASSVCVTLSSAYEDTRYKAVIVGGNAETKSTKTIHFYS